MHVIRRINMVNKRNKRTKKAYMELFDNPKALFDGVETIIFPNGQPEIWFKSDELGVRLKIGRGRAGMSITVYKLYATPNITVAASDESKGGWYETPMVDACQYKEEKESLEFRDYYYGEKKQ
jgi:hypothetical protein